MAVPLHMNLSAVFWFQSSHLHVQKTVQYCLCHLCKHVYPSIMCYEIQGVVVLVLKFYNLANTSNKRGLYCIWWLIELLQLVKCHHPILLFAEFNFTLSSIPFSFLFSLGVMATYLKKKFTTQTALFLLSQKEVYNANGIVSYATMLPSRWSLPGV